jgi:hypothetical protein
MKKLLPYILPSILACLAFGAGTWSEKASTLRAEHALFAKLEACGYQHHGISDLAWIYYLKGMAPAGSARYYSSMVSSQNTGEVYECIKREIG